MASKEHAHRHGRELPGRQAAHLDSQDAEMQGQQIAIQHATTAPQPRSPGEVLHLQRTIGNQAVSRSLQRWPAITSGSGTFTYTLGDEFADKHVANSVAAAKKKAQDMYDPWHKDPHRAAVTVILQASLALVTNAVEVTPKGGYDWALTIDVDAVMMGPSGRAGGGGDPGQLDTTITSVVVSGYSTGPTTGKITHVSASQ